MDKVDLTKAIEALNAHITVWAEENNVGVVVLFHNPATGAPIGFVSSEKGPLKIARLASDSVAQILFQLERVKTPAVPNKVLS